MALVEFCLLFFGRFFLELLIAGNFSEIVLDLREDTALI